METLTEVGVGWGSSSEYEVSTTLHLSVTALLIKIDNTTTADMYLSYMIIPHACIVLKSNYLIKSSRNLDLDVCQFQQ